MKKFLKRAMQTALRRFGYSIGPYRKDSSLPPDFSADTEKIWEAVKPFTMTSPERVSALVDAVQYLTRSGIEGDFVECGVWKVGSTMAMALALMDQGSKDRDLWLYDTFAGMPAPTEIDIEYTGRTGREKYSEHKNSANSSDWYLSPIDEVRRNILQTGYDVDRIHFVKGKVEDTIPTELPKKIALLRLDTDWYASTKHELIHLFPLVQPRGVVIIDDYGHWQGSKKAVDEYMNGNHISIFWHRIDYTGRIGVKV